MYRTNIDMRSVIIFMIVFYGQCLLAQEVIPMNGHKGVLFADTVKLDFNIDSAARRFTPLESEAILADEIIFESKEVFAKSWGKSFNKEIKKSCRQFVGYYDLNGDKHVIVLLLNMSKASSKHYFKEWLTKPIVGFGEFYEKNLKILNVNLSQRKAAIY
jgi:hypothetical protein